MPLLRNVVSAALLHGACAAIAPSTDARDSLASCSPSTCKAVTKDACSFKDPGIDWAQLIGSVSCRKCTQSADKRCSSMSLKRTLVADSAVKAAYRNDKFLVV